MLSKEEIKNIKEIKDMLNYASMCVHSNLQLDNKSSRLLYSYIEQLETNNQKLIEKLEKDIQKANEIINDKEYRYIQEVIDEQYERRKYAKEILEIVKGEK